MQKILLTRSFLLARGKSKHFLSTFQNKFDQTGGGDGREPLRRRFSSTDEENKHVKTKKSLVTKVKQVVAEHGKIAIGFHVSVWMASMSGSYCALHYGIDVQHLMASTFPFLEQPLSKIDPNTGQLVLAYLLTTATGPVRGALTVAAVPMLDQFLKREQKKNS